jgi:hypothetical protein
MRGVKDFTGAAAAVLLMALAGPVPALADTIEAALVRAYQNNPQLNAQRAAPKGRAHRERRLPIHRYQFHPGRYADRDRPNRNSRH